MITTNSKAIRPGDTFLAVKGDATDGARFIQNAIDAGAVRIIAEVPRPRNTPDCVEWECVPDSRIAAARYACTQAGNPSHALSVFGVTGTNGKTTVANLIRWLLTGAGIPCGLVSTIENDVNPLPESNPFGSLLGKPALNTTPGPFELQNLFRSMLDNRCRAAAIEVSSHALAQHRTDGTRFSAAVFTNLTQDHLDYHHTLEAYFAAKRRLFIPDSSSAAAPPACAVIQTDDPFGQRLAADCRSLSPQTLCRTYGFGNSADFRIRSLRLSPNGTTFEIAIREDSSVSACTIRTHLLGRHNALNLTAALAAVSSAAKIEPTRLADILESAPPVRGRLEPVHAPDSPASFFIDYAHTPDAIENVCRTLREITKGRLFILFGAGGDRDRTKRPRMGEAAARLADALIVTSDNPRSENPDEIIREILAGIPSGTTCRVEPDRAKAIRLARRLATSPDDTVLIAGKGHETYQIIGSQTLSFDDRNAVSAP